MTKITRDCSSCEGSKYCISKPKKEDYKFPKEENQYLIDLECGVWNCHTAVMNLLKENAELKEQLKNNPYVIQLQKEKAEIAEDFAKQIEKMKAETQIILEDNDTLNKWNDELRTQIENLKMVTSSWIMLLEDVRASEVNNRRGEVLREIERRMKELEE